MMSKHAWRYPFAWKDDNFTLQEETKPQLKF